MPPYAYLRKSVVRNPETDLSPETQEREVRALAARHGDNGKRLTLLADWDISGAGRHTRKRAGYQQLVAAIESGQCSALYSYSLSRLARSSRELIGLFERCTERGVPIRLVVDNLDTSTASGVMHAQMLAAMAEFESNVASERTKASIATRRARGERVGPRFYGEGRGENEQAVLDAFREAGSFHGAAKLLNERGIPTRHGRRGWWASSVGKMVQRLDPTIRRGKARTKTAPEFALARLLICPTCGTTLTGRRDHGTVRYQCAQGTVKPHPRSSVSERAFLPAIIAEADRFRPRTEAHAIEQDADRGKRGALEAKRERIIDTYTDGLIDKAERDRRLEKVTRELDGLDLTEQLVMIPEAINWDAPPRELNTLLRTLWSSVALDPETFQPKPDGFEWRLPRKYVA